MTQEDFVATLSFVLLKDDNLTMLLNGELGYPVALPKYILVKKNREDRIRIVEKKIFDGCHMYYLDYISEDNVKKLAKEIVNLLYERANVAKAAAASAKEEEEEDGEESAAAAAVAVVEEEPEPKIELTPELTKEVSFDEIADILSISIKKDKAPKLITFCAMLLAQTNKDQLNVGFQAESSAGKSYIPLELANYFPKKEIMKIAGASPTSLYHKGVWDAEKKILLCDLEHKNIIFLDNPHFLLLEKLRPVLAKDDKELHFMITDKNRSGAIRTKDIIIRGYPSICFCTAKMDPDEQEKTRLILLSPSVDEEKLKETLLLSSLRNGNTEEYRKFIEQDPNRKWLMDRIYSLRQGGTREIIIPENGRVVYDRFIREHDHLIARHQRDLPRICAFIKASALLNAFNRAKTYQQQAAAVAADTTTTIIANETDIEAGFALYREIEASNELGLSPFIYRIYKEVIEPNLNAEGLSRKDIRSNYFKVFHKPLHSKFGESIIEQLESAGLVHQEPDPSDKRKMLLYHPVTGDISQQEQKEEDIFWQLFERLNGNGRVSETMLKGGLISSGKFTAGEAAQLINDMKTSGEVKELEYDILCKKTDGNGGGGGA